MNENIKQIIADGKTALGIEFGSTRIKAVLIDSSGKVFASGSHNWENEFKNGIWTYSLEDVWSGLQDSYRKLAENVTQQTGEELKVVGAIGVSAMMHGYLAFDVANNQLAEFRTWRNTITEKAAAILSERFHFNIPQRWSISHLYQVILNDDSHVKDVSFLTTLAGYVHWKLTGEKVLGIGDASGMFPIDSTTGEYDAAMMDIFDSLVVEKSYPWKLSEILPKPLISGENAGSLTADGAKLIDPSGCLRAGIPLCPPEGDMQTGMIATNSITPNTGNVSAGTSINAVIVLEKALKGVYPEIDIVATPAGSPTVLIHGNNCSSEIDAWAKVFLEAAEAIGFKADMGKVLDAMFLKALEGDADCGKMVYYNYLSGETITHLNEGRPMFIRKPDASFTFANFARMQLYSAIATLKLGMDILTKGENVQIKSFQGHGGYFKAEGVGQKLMAGALCAPVTVSETAGEGGPWGMALLAWYMKNNANGEPIDTFLNKHIFSGQPAVTVQPEEADITGFEAYMELFVKGLAAEKAAIENI